MLGVTLPWHVDGTSVRKGGAGSGVVDVAGVREGYRAALAQRQAALARQLSLFGSGDWGAALRRHGALPRPRREQGLDAHGRGGAVGSAQVDKLGSRLLRRFPRGSALVPSPVVGTLSGVQAGEPLALALNGRIAAVSAAYRNPGGGPVRFSLLAGEDAFRTGRERGARVRARRVPVAAEARGGADGRWPARLVGLARALGGDEEAAVRALEPAGRGADEQLGLEGLAAVRTDDGMAGLGGGLGHGLKLSASVLGLRTTSIRSSCRPVSAAISSATAACLRRSLAVRVDLDEAPAAAAGRHADHQQRLEPEPSQQRGLHRLRGLVEQRDSPGLAERDRLGGERVVGDQVLVAEVSSLPRGELGQAGRAGRRPLARPRRLRRRGPDQLAAHGPEQPA